jgi:hypothetical protein
LSHRQCRYKTITISKKLHILLLLAGLFCLQSASAQIKFYAQVSESPVGNLQPFQVQYVVEGTKNVRDFKLPRFSDFRVEQDFDEVSNVLTINGNTRQFVESYNKIVVLIPRRVGRFTIPAAEAMVNGKKMRSNMVTVVVQRTAPSMPAIGGGLPEVDVDGVSELKPGMSAEDAVKKNFFIRAEVNKTSCYVGEPLMATYKAYMRLNANAQVTKRPALGGFSVIDMVDNYDNRQEVELYNGVAYYTNVIRKVQLVPLQEGEFALDEAEIEGVARFNKRDPATDSWTAVNQPVSIRSEPVKITVKPLPVAGQPASFHGAVGNFSIAVKAPPSPLRQGDLVKIQVIVSGTGNLSLLTAPAVTWPKGVDTADPAVKEEINKYTYPLSGSKQFEYAFAAPDTGDCTVPVIELHYYDPEQKAYKTAVSEPITLHIVAGPSKAEMVQRNTAIEEGNETGIPKHLYFFAAIVLLIIGRVGYQWWQLRKAKKRAKETVIQQVAAPVVPEPRMPDPDVLLEVARDALQQVDKRLFCHEVQRVLWNTVAEKCQVPPSALNKSNITGSLIAKGVPLPIIQGMLSVFQECEWALYAPDQQVDDMKRIFYEARTILQQLQKL